MGYPTTTEFFPDGDPALNAEILRLLAERLGEPIDVERALAILDPIVEFRTTLPGQFLHHKRGSNWWEEIETFTLYAQERCFKLYGVIPELESVREVYGPLLSLLNPTSQAVSIYTANYDPVTDAIMEIAELDGVRCFDGFSRSGWWLPKSYGARGVGIDIYRLHGSMSWILHNDRVKNTRDYSLRRGETDHLLIYPGYKGDPMKEAQEPYRFAHQAFRSELMATDVLIAIGFSFRDEHINSAVADSLQGNGNLRIIVVNPEFPLGMKTILSGLGEQHAERVVAVEGKFGEAETIQAIASALHRSP